MTKKGKVISVPLLKNGSQYSGTHLEPCQIFKIKDTLMQICKSPYMFVFIKNQYPENFAFLILRILELFALEVRKSFKK